MTDAMISTVDNLYAILDEISKAYAEIDGTREEVAGNNIAASATDLALDTLDNVAAQIKEAVEIVDARIVKLFRMRNA